MTRIDFSPLYRSSVGFDRMASLLDSALNVESQSGGYPPYNIEVVDENRYAVTLAVAGFEESELDIQVERGVLTVRGKKTPEAGEKRFLHQGIAYRAFERKFNLADHVEIVNADLRNGLLSISLVREIPEAHKPKKIAINQSVNSSSVLTHPSSDKDGTAAA